MDFERLAERYTGPRAAAYNAERHGGRKWERENLVLASLIGLLPRALKVLDVPVGTGRMFHIYKTKAFEVTGLDVSLDMLAEAASHAKSIGLTPHLDQGSIRRLPYSNSSFDLVVCVRFLNWVDFEGVSTSLAELARVSRKHLLVGVRHMAPVADLLRTPWNVVRPIRRMLGHARARATNSGLVYHEKDELEQLFDELRLTICERGCVEKRSDGTDYYIYLLSR